MFSALAVATVAAHAGPWAGGFGWLFFLIPLFWILVFVALFAIFGRRRRAMWGAGPWAGGPHAWQAAQAVAGAESVLAQRYANGDIDEKEYRARLEVLRATGPVPPAK